MFAVRFFAAATLAAAAPWAGAVEPFSPDGVRYTFAPSVVSSVSPNSTALMSPRLDTSIGVSGAAIPWSSSLAKTPTSIVQLVTPPTATSGANIAGPGKSLVTPFGGLSTSAGLASEPSSWQPIVQPNVGTIGSTIWQTPREASSTWLPTKPFQNYPLR